MEIVKYQENRRAGLNFDKTMRNIDSLPRGTGARYMLATRGEGTDWIAHSWAYKRDAAIRIASAHPNAIVIYFG